MLEDSNRVRRQRLPPQIKNPVSGNCSGSIVDLYGSTAQLNVRIDGGTCVARVWLATGKRNRVWSLVCSLVRRAT